MGLITSLVFVPDDLRSDRLCTSLHILHIALDTSSYFVAHILYLPLDTSSLLPCAYIRVRWIRLLYFVAHTSCYV